MLVLVITFNIALTLFNCYLAWQIWNLGRGLAQFSRNVNTLDRNFQQILLETPVIIAQAATRTQKLQLQYQTLIWQLQQLQKFLNLINFGYKLRKKAIGNR